MINEVARMRFQSGRNPEEAGAVVITDDGFVQIEPSEDFLKEMARLEDIAVERSRKIGMVTTAVFFGLGALCALAAWMMGRIGGQMREVIEYPRPVDDVNVNTNDRGGIRVSFAGTGPQKVSLEWERGEIDECEAAHFVATYNRFRDSGA